MGNILGAAAVFCAPRSPKDRLKPHGVIAWRRALCIHCARIVRHGQRSAYAVCLHHHLRAECADSLAFFEKAFGLKRRFLHKSGDYGELETGATTLAFASLALGRMNLPAGYVAACESHQPLGFEVARVTPAVEQAHAQAIAAGAEAIKSPEVKPWGQMVSYVRCPDGVLVEICAPMGG